MGIKTAKQFQIKNDWHLSKVQQVADAIKKEILRSVLKKGEQLPSINEFSSTYKVARDTVEKAYLILKKERFITSVKGRGYFVQGSPDRKLKVLLVMNKISAYKKIVYNSFVKTLGNKAGVDLHIHHYRLDILKEILETLSARYDYVVVMPHFTHEVAAKELPPVFKIVPYGKLVLLDKNVPGFDASIEVCQDFESDIFDALQKHAQLMAKYGKIVVILRADEFHPREIIKGIRKFCSKHRKKFSVAEDAEMLQLEPGTLYIETSESDLAYLMKRSKEQRLKLAKDIGVLSFNETVLKDLLHVTVVTTDFAEMGRIAASRVLENQAGKYKVPFRFIRRKTV